MRDYHAFRQTAIRYWERRRIIYNVVLVPPAICSYALTDFFNFVGDAHKTPYTFILPLFAVSAIASNLCYTLAYAFEFLFGSDDPTSRWMSWGRTTVFAGGLVLAVLLALMGGYNIAEMEWFYRLRRA